MEQMCFIQLDECCLLVDQSELCIKLGMLFEQGEVKRGRRDHLTEVEE